jgi:hypothetical protein
MAVVVEAVEVVHAYGRDFSNNELLRAVQSPGKTGAQGMNINLQFDIHGVEQIEDLEPKLEPIVDRVIIQRLRGFTNNN